MKIIVQHADFDNQTGAVLGYTPVAEVAIPVDISTFGTLTECLEYAYRWTNNVMGSWSIKEEYFLTRKGEPVHNGDYNENVTVLRQRPDGMGQRSSMMNDRFIAGLSVYKVAVMGFKKVEMETV